jgi:peptidyl-prolyl cis-trans isomerase D
MLSFFRRIINSRAGVVVTFVVLAVIAIAFAASDITGLSSGTTSIGGGSVARVDGDKIGPAELRQAAEGEVEALRREQPGLDMAGFVAAGGLDNALERMLTGLALDRFGASQGMVVSKRSVDGEIASIPGLQGPTGRFDQALYERLVAERRLTDAQVRRDIAREIMARWLTAPQVGASQVPAQLALPYASLLLEKRSGSVALIPAATMPAGAPPTVAEIATFYSRNRARYTVPERRVVRYAAVSPAQVAAQATPSAEDVARAFAADRARYAPSERRTIAQVIVADRAGADALAAKVRGGQSVADAARAAGLEASTQREVDRAAYTASAGKAAADAAFGGAKGAVVGPVRGTLGFVVARIEAVEQVPGRTLDQVRPEIVAALTKQKTAEALDRLRSGVEEALADDATFDEVVADRKLAATTTKPLLASGVDPDAPTARPDPTLLPMLQAAFGSEEGDRPQVVPLGTDGGFAVVALGRVVPAAPRPIDQIRAQLVRDLVGERQRAAARKVADQVAAKAGRGGPGLAAALSAAGVRGPAPRPVSFARAQLVANPRAVPPALVMMALMTPGTAKVVEAPDRSGWTVVRLDRIDAGDARRNAGVVEATRADMGRVVGREFVEQLARAARKAVNARIDADAVAAVRRQLTQGGGNN